MIQQPLPAQAHLTPSLAHRYDLQPSQPVAPPLVANSLLIPEDQPLPPARRLLVLISDVNTDEAELAQRIWSLASPRGLEVLYLGLCRDSYQEPRARRRLASLAAMTRDDWARVETRLALGGDWVRAVQTAYRSGDLIVCHAEQSVSAWGFVRKPLSRVILSAFNSAVFVLSGFYPEIPSDQPNLTAQILSWVIPVVIVAGFSWIQIRIEQLPKDWAHTALLSISVVVEYSLIGIWSHFAL